MKRFAIAIATLALIASTSQACPLFGRRAKCSSSTVTYSYAPVDIAQAAPANSEVVPVQYVSPAKPLAQASSCANGQCGNQALQVGPSRGFFFVRPR